jgi:regulator of protease activity HflC (stomatin/prohibitin superfamily)
VTPVSLQRDFRHFQDITINDRRGTSVLIDLWVEVRIEDPARALFAVEDWEESLKSLLTHLATSVLSSCEFSQILVERLALGERLRVGAEPSCLAWGLSLEVVQLRKVSLLPDVSRQMFNAVGACLEMAKAEVEEEGRIRISMLEATTSAKVAALVAEAKSQHLAAVGRAYAAMASCAEVLTAYTDLYELSLASTDRLISFQGFERGEIKPLDAAMVVGTSVEPERKSIPRPTAPH